MKTVFVGLRNGQKSLNLPYIGLLSLVLPLLLGVAMEVAIFVSTRKFSLTLFLYGAFLGFGIVAMGIVREMFTRKEKLKSLD